MNLHQKQSTSYWSDIDLKTAVTKNALDTYQKRIDMEMQIKGTTDLLILQSNSAALKDLNFGDIANISIEDPDAARAVLLLPSEKYTRKFKDEGKAHIQDALNPWSALKMSGEMDPIGWARITEELFRRIPTR